MYGYDSYKANDIETASPVKLVVLLYGGAIRFSYLAVEAIKKNDIEAANENILKAQNIVSELLASLNYDAGNIADDLSNLYIYIHRLLVEGNIQKNAEPVQEAIELLSSLKEAWDSLLTKEVPTSVPKKLNISG